MYQFTYTNTTRRGDMNFLTRTLVIVITVFMVLTLPTIESNSSGIHNRAGSGCTCHYSGSTPTLSENFPTTYTAGQTYNIQISVSGGVSGNNGGFNVVVDKGTLSIPGVGIMSVKIDSAGQSATHTTNSYRSWSFDWTAPSTGSGSTNVDIAVMSANGNNGNSGDAWTTSSITIPEAGPSNTAPTASNVYISDMPGSPTAITQAYYDTDLFANYDFNDADGDAESGTQIRWLRGGVEVAQHNDINLLNQGATSIGDIWTLTITPSDGTDLGAKVTSSNSVEIIDYDADGDGYGDQSDAFPNDSNEWADSDSDGVGDNADAFDDDNTQTTDSDGDGYGDNASGNNPDAFPNDANEWLDSDNDGVGDNADAFPNDPTETVDSDLDGVGDNADAFPNDASETADSDNDGVGNNADAFPNDPSETADSDSDGVGDNADAFPNDASETADSDLDGVGDNADAFPNDASETMDSDGDNVGDNADAFPNDPTETTDTDGDMVGDNADVFPNDATETSDADEDMIGDNADTDDDNDGLLDTEEATIGTDPFDEDTDGDEVNDKDDALPLDASETMDTDGDGTGDNADTDDDGDGLFDLDELSKGTDRLDPDSDDDGVLDGADVFPMDATETIDSDNDGVGDNADAFPNDPLETVDTDADGVGDNADAFPEDASETMDSDGDGMGDNEQKELEDEAAARMQLMIIIGVVLVLAIVGGLLFMRRKNGDSMESKETTPLPQADPIQPAQEMYATTPEPVQPMVAEPTVENQWTDENGHTWRRMSDGSTLWWNGTDWQQV